MDLLEAHQAGPEDGKVLNCLDIPLPRSRAPHPGLSTDSHAYATTEGLWTADRNHAYPSLDWGLIGCNDAHHYWHVDVNGVATQVLVRCGVKLWFLARPKPGCDFASTDFFLNNDIHDTTNKEWDVEVVVLRGGDELYMRPNTPHLVITAESAVCRGGYLICYTTIRETSYGLFHCAIQNRVITNVAEFNEALFLVRRLVMYWVHAIPGSE
ncbi:hypothetical protein BDN72DRAFT_778921 [Pluteus cervinus]|uniref:Uncharacterized protein n=1 Tax=Pluteus cervinus TaxID=181527 RepID=A0ACD3A5A0_9AGAR|nr:hypothetical protein BDN72DRAFT_778921 [Pluteus cervinus]